MKDSIKNQILAVSIILTIGACFMAISSTNSASKVQEGLDLERYNRMVAEEKLEKANSKMISLQTELDNTKSKIQSIQAVLDQGKSTTSELKSQLDSVTKLKDSLERKMSELKNAQAMPVAVANPPVNTE